MGTRGIINLKRGDKRLRGKEKAAVDMKVKFAAFINSGEIAEQLLVKWLMKQQILEEQLFR